MTPSATTACLGCREQKLKCSREQPDCARCVRLHLSCHYPEPPDRKLLASLRRPPKRRKHQYHETPSMLPEDMKSHEPANLPVPQSFQLEESVQFADDTLCNGVIRSLTPQVQSFLVDVYFKHMYHACLLFHSPDVLERLRKGLLPTHAVVAIFATATIFLRPGSSLYRSKIDMLRPLGQLDQLGRQWAKAAGREVLQDIDRPCLTSIQTCEVLALYWFAAGESQRNTMFSGIAYKAVCVLGWDRVRETAAPSAAMEIEVQTRCFWAVWITNCISCQHYTIGTSVNEHILSLPLPADDLSTTMANGNRPQMAKDRSIPSENDVPSIMAELIRLMMIWAKIGDFLSGCKQMKTHTRLSELFSLDLRLSEWRRALHPSLAYSKRNLYKHLVTEEHTNFVFIHALYYQCCLVLHSSIVPQFSGSVIEEALSVEVINTSAHVALRSAKKISELSSDLIALDWDCSRIAPFVGYCIYVSSSILTVFLYSKDLSVSAGARRQISSNLHILGLMKEYWSNLERLWVRIHILFEAQPPWASSSSSHIFPNGDSVDEIPDKYGEGGVIQLLARQPRDAPQLREPLARSVLKYGLHLRAYDQSSGTIEASKPYEALGNTVPAAERISLSASNESPALPVSAELLRAQEYPRNMRLAEDYRGQSSAMMAANPTRGGPSPPSPLVPEPHGTTTLDTEPVFLSDPAWNLLQEPNESWLSLSLEDQTNDFWQVGLDLIGLEQT